MPKAYTLIQTQTLSANSTSVTFVNIPQNFTDLKLTVSARGDASAINDNIYVKINGSNSGYTVRAVWENAAQAYSYTSTTAGLAAPFNQATSTNYTFNSMEIYYPNYTSANSKSYTIDNVCENNSSTANYSRNDLLAGVWSGTSAITVLTITPGSGNFIAGSIFSLYGIGGAKASGGTITYDGGYAYHTFTSSGTFTALEKINNAECLVIAGGGGGGGSLGGGGGAGGLIYAPYTLLPAGTTYTALIGAAGSAGSGSTIGSNGGNSSFGSYISIGGGGAGCGNQGNGAASALGSSGGSGGGAGSAIDGYSHAGGSPTTSQGNTGGSTAGYQSGASNTWSVGGAGGGGAGAVGASVTGGSTTNSVGGAGGIGAYYMDWTLATSTGANGYYAGGGSGGGLSDYGSTIGPVSGGLGGGGNGGWNGYEPTAGGPNTGGGGGGAHGGGSAAGAAGGSGVIIIRYPND